MAPSDDLPLPPRRPLLLPVAIATALLVVIGLSVGLVMGARAQDRVTVTTVSPSSAPAITSTAPEVTSSATAGPSCRAETQKAAQRFGPAGALTVVLRIRTATSSVWICSDAEGRLYYHANKGRENGPWVEGETALFLPDVVRYDGGYRATATDAEGQVTTFDVSSERLLITHKDGREEQQPAR